MGLLLFVESAADRNRALLCNALLYFALPYSSFVLPCFALPCFVFYGESITIGHFSFPGVEQKHMEGQGDSPHWHVLLLFMAWLNQKVLVHSPPHHTLISRFPLWAGPVLSSLGEHQFTLRSRATITEVAVRIDDVQYYTLPSIALLQFPTGTNLKKPWESVCRSLVPFRDDIINDSQRIHAISEFEPARLPEGEPGAWANHMLRDIARKFRHKVQGCPFLVGFKGKPEGTLPAIFFGGATKKRTHP